MEKNSFIMPAALVLLILLVAGVAYFLGTKHGVESMSIQHVTPTQVASAMKDDHFYSSYKQNTLVMSGQVTSVSQANNDLVVGFHTDSTFKALCDFGNSSMKVKQGDTITILSEGGSALRQPSAVLLKNCVSI